MSEFWQNRLAFLQGIIETPEEKEKEAAPTTEEPKQVKRKRTIKKPNVVQEKIEAIKNDAIKELLNKEALFLALQLFRSAKEIINENSDNPSEENVQVVKGVLLEAIKFFQLAKRPVDQLWITDLLVQWLAKHGTFEDKRYAIRIAKGAYAKSVRMTDKRAAQSLKSTIKELEAQLASAIGA